MSGPFRHMTVQQLESLLNLVEEGSFSRAAKKMHLTQPSLSKHIQNMEDIVGGRVVERKNTGIELTPEGKVLFDCAKRVFRQIEDAEERISYLKESNAGRISIAASTIPATYLLPPVLSAFRQKHPEICGYVRMNDSSAVLDMVLEGEAELGFVGREITNRKLVVERLWNDRMVLVVPSTHRWRRNGEISWAEVSKEPFVARERGSATRASLENYLDGRVEKGFASFNIVCEMGSSEAVKETVLAGLGTSILSIHAVKRELEKGALYSVTLPEPPIERNFYLIYKKRFAMKKYHRLFLEFLRTQAGWQAGSSE